MFACMPACMYMRMCVCMCGVCVYMFICSDVLVCYAYIHDYVHGDVRMCMYA